MLGLHIISDLPGCGFSTATALQATPLWAVAALPVAPAASVGVWLDSSHSEDQPLALVTAPGPVMSSPPHYSNIFEHGLNSALGNGWLG